MAVVTASGCGGAPNHTVPDFDHDRYVEGVMDNVDYIDEHSVRITFDDGRIIGLRVSCQNPVAFPTGKLCRVYFKDGGCTITGIGLLPEKKQTTPTGDEL
jgi:hypothetical protein